MHAFDSIVEGAEAMLQHPSVQEALGSTQVKQYSTILDGAYLPNIRDGYVSLPRVEYRTDNVAFIPVLASDNAVGLHIQPSMLTPTQRRFDAIHNRSAQRHGVSHAQTAQSLVGPILSQRELLPENLAALPVGVQARTSAVAVEVGSDKLALTPRPHVMFGVGLAEQSRISRGAKVVHELQHVIDVEKLFKLPRDPEDWIVGSEMRAGRLTYTLLEAVGVICDNVVVDDDVANEGFRSVIRIERLRRRHNSGVHPYARHPAVVKAIMQGQGRNDRVVGDNS